MNKLAQVLIAVLILTLTNALYAEDISRHSKILGSIPSFSFTKSDSANSVKKSEAKLDYKTVTFTGKHAEANRKFYIELVEEAVDAAKIPGNARHARDLLSSMKTSVGGSKSRAHRSAAYEVNRTIWETRKSNYKPVVKPVVSTSEDEKLIKYMSEKQGLYALYLEKGLGAVASEGLLDISSDIELFRKHVAKMSYTELQEKAKKYKIADYLQ